MRRLLSILSIGGHPKDAFMYAGGTMAKHAALGDRVCVLTPTSGVSHHLRAIDTHERGNQVADYESLKEELRQEFISSAAELGITDARFLGHDDEIVTVDREIISEIADVIGELQPDIVITHWPYDSVAHHRLATDMTDLAMDAAAQLRPGKPYRPHRVPQIYYHASPGRDNIMESIHPRIPTTIVDISDVLDKKIRAMGRIRSQYYDEMGLGDVPDGYYGIHGRFPFTEAFVAHNPHRIYDSLPPPEELGEGGRSKGSGVTGR